MSNNEVRTVLVVGGGIAGLSAAIVLSQLGKQVTLVERSQEAAEGAGITIQNQGIPALQELGVLDACIEASNVKWEGSIFDSFFDAEGNLRNMPPLPTREEDGLPSYMMIYRPRLARILAQRAEELGAEIRRGVKVMSVTDQGETVEVEFADGARASFDLVVGADGTNSPIRKQIFGDIVTSTYSGNMSLRWVKRGLPKVQPGFYVNESSAPVVIHYPDDDMVYIASGIDMENRELSREEAVRIFREVLSDFNSPVVQELLSAVEDDDEVIARPYMLHNMPAPWHKGRIVLIGDAVHTMSAHLASGGVMALEDAIVLKEEFRSEDDLEAALLRYARRRARRTYIAVDACRQMLELQVLYHAHPADLSRVRTAAITELVKPA